LKNKTNKGMRKIHFKTEFSRPLFAPFFPYIPMLSRFFCAFFPTAEIRRFFISKIS